MRDGDRLYYYKSKEEMEALGFIDLAVFKISSSIELKKEMPAPGIKGFEEWKPFQINTPSRLYRLVAPNDSECDKWVRGLTKLTEKDKQQKKPSPPEAGLLGASRIQEGPEPGWKSIHVAILNNKFNEVADLLFRNVS